MKIAVGFLLFVVVTVFLGFILWSSTFGPWSFVVNFLCSVYVCYFVLLPLARFVFQDNWIAFTRCKTSFVAALLTICTFVPWLNPATRAEFLIRPGMNAHEVQAVLRTTGCQGTWSDTQFANGKPNGLTYFDFAPRITGRAEGLFIMYSDSRVTSATIHWE